MKTKKKTPNLATFGWLDAYKEKEESKLKARKEREIKGREELLGK